MWDFAGVVGDKGAPPYLVDGGKMPGANWFPRARLNFAENLLRRRDDDTAIVFWGENKVRRKLTFRELYDQVSCTAQALRALGLATRRPCRGLYAQHAGNRHRHARHRQRRRHLVLLLAGFRPPRRVGSLRPDRAESAVLRRRLLLHRENPRRRWPASRSWSGSCPPLQKVVVVPYVVPRPLIDAYPTPFTCRLCCRLQTSRHRVRAGALRPSALYPLLLRDHRRAQVHRAWRGRHAAAAPEGAPAAHRPQARRSVVLFHHLRLDDVELAGLGSRNGATLLLYDGSPFHPNPNVLFDLADTEGMTVFGTSAKYIDALAKLGVKPKDTHRLASVVTMASTGSPLSPESFEYVYAISNRTCCCRRSRVARTSYRALYSAARGAGLARGDPVPGLGLKVEVYGDDGRALIGEKGELVCSAPFPSMPIGFWNDPDGKKYLEAYFTKFPNVWCHGDYMELTARGIADHIRALRCRAQPRRRAHRYGGDIPPGRTAPGGSGKPCRSARTGTTTCGWCCLCDCAKGWSSMKP